MKKAYIYICIPPAAAILALLLIRLIFMQSEDSLRPTMEEINKAPVKHSAATPGQGGSGRIKFDPDRLRKILEESKNEGGEESSSETTTTAPKSQSAPELAEQKGPFKDDLQKERNQNADRLNHHNRIVLLISDIAAMLVALAGYGTIGYMFWKQYKKPIGWEEALATARQEAAAQRGSAGPTGTNEGAGGGTGAAADAPGTDSDLVFMDEDDMDDDYEVGETTEPEPNEGK